MRIWVMHNFSDFVNAISSLCKIRVDSCTQIPASISYVWLNIKSSWVISQALQKLYRNGWMPYLSKLFYSRSWSRWILLLSNISPLEIAPVEKFVELIDNLGWLKFLQAKGRLEKRRSHLLTFNKWSSGCFIACNILVPSQLLPLWVSTWNYYQSKLFYCHS